jgi:PAS domain S-box-containing protein
MVTDLAGTIRDCNYAATRLFHSSKSFLQGKPLPFFICREGRPEFYDHLILLRGPGAAYQEWEARLEPKAGVAAFMGLTAVGYADAEGRPAGLRWLIRDVSARRAVEEAAGRQGLDRGPDRRGSGGGAPGRRRRPPAAVQRLPGMEHGFGRESLLGAAWLDRLVDPASRAAVQSLFQQAGRAGVRARATFPVRTRQGGPRLIAWAAEPVRDAHGIPKEVLAVGHDITDLEEAQRKAVQLERLAAIGQTAAGLAHEGRNALQRGQACLERLKWRLQGQAEALALVERAQQAQEALLRLYESVREFAAPIRIDPTRCDPAEVWRQAWQEVRGRAAGRDAALEEDLPSDLDRTCRADRFVLWQVFRNLFENSLAACPDPVRVRVVCRDAEPDPGQASARAAPALRISVHDNGPGLTGEQRRRMFEPFFSTKPQGAGLGLAIVKRILEAHGGQASLGAGAGGAEITLTLPRGTP